MKKQKPDKPKPKVDVVGIAQRQRYAHLIEKMKVGKSLSKSEIDELAEFDGKVASPKQADVNVEQLLKTQRQAADYANVNTRTIRRWLSNGMPTSAEGYYIKGILDFFKNNESRAPNENRQRFLKAEADLKETKSELANIELRIKRGELIESAEIEAGRVARILAVKRAFRGLGRNLALRLSKMGGNPSGIQKAIDAKIREIIEEFARD